MVDELDTPFRNGPTSLAESSLGFVLTHDVQTEPAWPHSL